MVDELIDIYDENMATIGTATRADAHRRGLWHAAVHCWVVRPEAPGYVLFQARHASPVVEPGLLDVTASGHCPSGEGIERCARAVPNELGLRCDYSSLVPLGIKIDVGRLGHGLVIREFCRTYLLRQQRHPHEFVVDHSAVGSLIEIAIPYGLDLFAGARLEVPVQGVEYDLTTAQWRTVEMDIGPDHFFPRIDPYYYRVFIMADRFLRHERDLAI